MKKWQVVLTLFLILTGLIFLILFVSGYVKPQGAALLVDTQPTSLVMINGEQVGRTPYEGSFKPGEVIVKLIPEALGEPLSPYETKVVLTSGIKTVVRRTFANSEDTSSGEVISFEKTGSTDASLSIVSVPDAAEIIIDGQPRGFTPIKISRISAGEHQIVVKAEGYLEKSSTIKAENGYRLTYVVKLALNPNYQAQEESEEVEKEEIVYVEILSTPTGFLRVREKPSTAAEEVGRVTPGIKYKLLSQDENEDWYEIEFGENESGWVSSEYASISGQIRS